MTASDVDVFIAYGQRGWDGTWTELLAEARFSPICSPRLLQQGLREPADLARFRLLHLGDRTDWLRWLAAARVSEVDGRHGIVFSDMNLVLSAALAGQGVAMGDTMTSTAALASGALVQPFAVTVPASGAYHLVADPGAAEAPLARAFISWLRAELTAVRRPA